MRKVAIAAAWGLTGALAWAGSPDDRSDSHAPDWAQIDAVIRGVVEARDRVERFQARVTVEIDTGEDRTVTQEGRIWFVRGVDDPDEERGEVGHRMMWRLRDAFQDVERLWHDGDSVVGVDELDRFIFVNREIGSVRDWEPVSLVFFGLTPDMRDDWDMEVTAVGGHGIMVQGTTGGVNRVDTVPDGSTDEPEGTEPAPPPTPEELRGEGPGERGPVSTYSAVVMTPRSADARRRFESAGMTIDHQTGIPIRIALMLANGRVRRITLDDLSVNQPFTDLEGNPIPSEEVLLTPDTNGYEE